MLDETKMGIYNQKGHILHHLLRLLEANNLLWNNANEVVRVVFQRYLTKY